MLRQKKTQLQRSAINQPLNLFLSSLLQLQPKPPEKPSVPVLKPKNQNRACLRQIQNTQHLTRQPSQESRSSSTNKLALDLARDVQLSKAKDQAQLFGRLSELIKDQKLNIAQSQAGHPKVIIERTQTSLSQSNSKCLDHSILCRGKLVLHLSNAEQKGSSQFVPIPNRISTSRALMNYSTVHRNASGERFKVRRGKSFSRNSVCLQAQKIVLQEKQKKERVWGTKSSQKGTFGQKTAFVQTANFRQKTTFRQKMPRQKGKTAKKDRYADQQQFQLDGWDYFQ